MIERWLVAACVGVASLAASTSDAAGQVNLVPGEPALAYWSLGPSAPGPKLIVVHGGPGLTHDYLRPEWERLASRREVVFYDQRGCGASGDASDYSWEQHVQDLARLIQEVSPEEPVFLAGSSWGAMLAWYYTERHPASVKGLVLSGLAAPSVWTLPGGEASDGPPEDIDRVRTFEERSRANRALADRVVGRCEQVRTETVASYSSAPPPWRLYTLTNPVLFFPDNRFGRPFGDAVEDPEIVASFTFVVGGGHDPWLFSPDEFFRVVDGFLTEPP